VKVGEARLAPAVWDSGCSSGGAGREKDKEGSLG